MSAEYALAGFVLIHELIGLPNRFHQRRDAEYTADADGELDIRTIVNHGAADGVLNGKRNPPAMLVEVKALAMQKKPPMLQWKRPGSRTK